MTCTYQVLGAGADGNPMWPSLLLCLRCSAYISDPDVHDRWHAQPPDLGPPPAAQFDSERSLPGGL